MTLTFLLSVQISSWNSHIYVFNWLLDLPIHLSGKDVKFNTGRIEFFIFSTDLLFCFSSLSLLIEWSYNHFLNSKNCELFLTLIVISSTSSQPSDPLYYPQKITWSWSFFNHFFYIILIKLPSPLTWIPGIRSNKILVGFSTFSFTPLQLFIPSHSSQDILFIVGIL